ncbi:hypothetical protein LIER_04561 [Lithospermum erythrorhizon]|uniref:GAG-pre-integrase domain-containing protein n=1 Tax=Lithospermum erythrorhizon TaxID=34254 RepID=A0AAV3NX61_LITER
MSIEAYFGKLQPLWDELHNLTPLPMCACGGITEQLMNMKLKERYHDFMYGLNRELYGSIRSALNTQDPLPSLDTAYQKIQEEESMRKVTDTFLGTELVALSLRSGTRLPDYGDKSKLSGPGGGCTTGSRATVQSAWGGAALNAVFSNAAGGQAGSGLMPSMTPNHWHHLMNIIGNSNPPSAFDRLMGKSIVFPWIFDTGATVYATGNLECLADQLDDVGFPLTLSNGSIIHSTRRGTDRSARTVIGAGERRGELYYFSEVPVDSTTYLLAIQTPMLELWHSRLDHPSEAVLKSLPFISSNNSVLNKSCETCHSAKHTRDVFFDNFNKATWCFELIHCDLWDPYRTPSSSGAKYFLTFFAMVKRQFWVGCLSGRVFESEILVFYSRDFISDILYKKGWKLLDLETQVYIVSLDVTFYEFELPGLTNSPELFSESRGVLYEDGSSFFGLDETSLGVDVSPSISLDGTFPPFEPNSPVLVEEAAATGGRAW